MVSKTGAVLCASALALMGLCAFDLPMLLAETAPRSSGHAAMLGKNDSNRVNVELPVSAKLFPAGDGSAIANSQCLMCHSADMVLLQPARTQEQWTETINKMRNSYGAPLPAEQVNALAAYLTRVVATPQRARNH